MLLQVSYQISTRCSFGELCTVLVFYAYTAGVGTSLDARISSLDCSNSAFIVSISFRSDHIS
jgi:hypothetical protein